jgi:hypothetical protein
MGPKTFQRRPSFSVANAQKYRFRATFILSDIYNHVVYMNDQLYNYLMYKYSEKTPSVREYSQ